MKRCSTSLIIREMQIKTYKRYTSHQSERASLKSLQITNTREDVEKREPSYTVTKNVNWCCHYAKQYGGSSTNTKNRATMWFSNPLLGIYSEKIIIQRDACTSMFTAALFTIAMTWNQPKWPSTEAWIKKIWYIYTMEYY